VAAIAAVRRSWRDPPKGSSRRSVLILGDVQEGTTLDSFTFAAIVLLAMAGLAAFDLIALRFGADSRDPAGDDRRWRIR
jgi:hypothetical protein